VAAVKDSGNPSPIKINYNEDDCDTVATTKRSNSTSQRSLFKPKLDQIQRQSQILQMWDIEEVSTVVSSEMEDDLECAEVSSCSGTNSSEREEDISQDHIEEVIRSAVSKRDDKTDINHVLLSTLCAAIEKAQLLSEDGTEIEITLENTMPYATAARPEPVNFLQKVLLNCSCTKQQSIQPLGVVAKIKVHVIPPKQVSSVKERSSNSSSDEFAGKV
jgi:hypothetical protein